MQSCRLALKTLNLKPETVNGYHFLELVVIFLDAQLRLMFILKKFLKLPVHINFFSAMPVDRFF